MCLALDWGEARIGVAACDRDGLLSYPVETVPAGPQALPRLHALVAEYEPARVLVGLPRTLAGDEGIAATKIRQRAAEFAAGLADGVEVRLIDERMTTKVAARQLQAAGRSSRKQRSVIDQAAAVGILEGALERRRAQGGWPGTVLSTATVVDTTTPQEES